MDELGKRSAQVVGNVFGGFGGEAISGLGGAGWRGTKYFPGVSPMHRIGRGAATEGVSDTVEELIENSKISTSLKQWAKGGSEKAKKALIKGEALGKQFDINFSAGQLTKNPTLLRLEGVLRQLPMSGDIWRAADSQRLKQFGVAYEAMVNHVAKGTTSAHEAGDIVAKLGPIIFDELSKARTKIGGEYFREAERLSGGKATVSIKNFLSVVDDLIAENGAPGKTGEAAIILEQALKVKNELLSGAVGASGKYGKDAATDFPARIGDVRISLKMAQNLLSDYGKRGRGTGKFAKDLDMAESIAISKRIEHAIEDDIVQHAMIPGAQGRAAQLNLEGRKVWAEMSQIIRDADDAIMAKAAGYADQRLGQEKIVQDMLKSTFSPARIAKTVQTMEKHSPDGLRKLRGAVLEEMLDQATRGVEEELVSPKAFVNMYRKNKKRLMALFSTDPAGFRVVREIAESAERLADNAGMAGSQTAPFWAMFQIITSSATPTGAAKNMMTMFYAKHLSMGLNSPKARMEMLGLAKPSGNWFTRGLSDATKFGSKQAARGITGAYYSDNENVIKTVNKLRELEAREQALFGKDGGERNHE